MTFIAGLPEEHHLIGVVTALVVGSGAFVYAVDRLSLWIAWWLGTTVLVGTILVLLNR